MRVSWGSRIGREHFGFGARLGREGGEGDLEGVEDGAGAADVEQVGGDAVGDLNGGEAERLAIGDGGEFEWKGRVAVDASAVDVMEAVVLAAHGGRSAAMAWGDAVDALRDHGFEGGQRSGFVDGRELRFVEHGVPPWVYDMAITLKTRMIAVKP